MHHFRSAIIIAAAISATALAQEQLSLPPLPAPHDSNFFYFQRGPMTAGPDVTFMSAEFGMEAKVVKGAPYSAQAVTEFTQTLADGNRINRTTTSSVARDSEGRTRREHSLGAIGPFAPSAEAPKLVAIHDPVSGKNYTLDANTKTAHVLPELPQHPDAMGGGVVREIHAASVQTSGEIVTGHAEAIGAVHIAVAGKDDEKNAKSESLGTQMIAGVNASGTRTTRTIPAGQIGNDRPIEITRETWYSPELQITVMSKTSDPRTGDSVYKLTNIDRSEPSPALFVVPSDYTVREGKGIFMSGPNVKVTQ
jgi:hypothetical protein